MKVQNQAPIALFVYNRPYHTLQTLDSLKKNPPSANAQLYIFADGPKNPSNQEETQKIRQVREIIRSQAWCGEVHIQENTENQGLAKNIIQGINYLIDFHEQVIVLEDDLVLSPGFLDYMHEALDFYRHEPSVMHISAYKYPVNLKSMQTFFYNIPSSWGWATWKRAWEYFEPDSEKLYQLLQQRNKIYHFDLEGSRYFIDHLRANISGKLHTWAIQWYASIFLQNGFCLYPHTSLVRNIGFDNSGTHCGEGQLYEVKELAAKVSVTPIPIREHKNFRRKMRSFYRYGGSGIRPKIIHCLNLVKAFLYKFIPLSLREDFHLVKNKFGNK